jgi:hypothetical protein
VYIIGLEMEMKKDNSGRGNICDLFL